MENKPQNLFDKLDKQGEQVEDISKKLEGVSINDLYALAKRTWDYGDYQTAQKYYNHISLLRPLEWKAPLYASLCNFKGYHKYSFWINTPKQLEKIYISTIKYINSLDLEKEKKENEMGECLEIIKDDIFALNDMYFELKDNFDEYDNNYIHSLQDCIFDTYTTLKNIKLDITKDYLREFANVVLDLICKNNRISPNISKENFEELYNYIDEEKEYDDSIYDKCKIESSSSIDNLTSEEIKEIKLHGTMYFEYNDKVISKRMFIRNLICSIILMILSIIGFVFSLHIELFYISLFILPFLYSIILMISTIMFKNKIKCSSFLCFDRKTNRLSSNGNIVTENRFNLLKINLYAGLFIQIFLSTVLFTILIESKNNVNYKFLVIISTIILTVIYFVSLLKNVCSTISNINGTFTYNYNNKNYKF